MDANNNAISGATVNFSADSGIITGAPATTDATGKAVVQLSAQGNFQNRTITVTATSGSSTAQIKVAVVGTTLTVSGPTSLVQGATGTYTISLTDSGSAGISVDRGGDIDLIAKRHTGTGPDIGHHRCESGRQTFTVLTWRPTAARIPSRRPRWGMTATVKQVTISAPEVLCFHGARTAVRCDRFPGRHG